MEDSLVIFGGVFPIIRRLFLRPGVAMSLLTIVVACSAPEATASDVRPACSHWGSIKQRLLDGEPLVVFEADIIATEAEESGSRQFTDLATDLSHHLNLWMLLHAAAGEPFDAELVAAATAFEDYCTARGVSAGDPMPSAASVLPEQEVLASTIRDRIEEIVEQRDAPYVVSQAGFEETGPEAQEAGLPEGIVWWVVFEDPIPVLDTVTMETVLYEPLDIYAEALRPEFEAGRLSFVIDYFLAWDNATKDVFEIPPFALNLYLKGEIDIGQFSEKIIITGLT